MVTQRKYTRNFFGKKLFSVVISKDFSGTIGKKVVSAEVRVCIQVSQNVVAHHSQSEIQLTIRPQYINSVSLCSIIFPW